MRKLEKEMRKLEKEMRKRWKTDIFQYKCM
jgi:hypothetical protein